VHLNQNVQCESNKQTYLSATLAELTILLITSLDKLCSTSNRCASPNLAIRWKANAVNQKNKANETSKNNCWSYCSQDDQCVTSVLNCTPQNTNSVDLDPHCDYPGISMQWCQITLWHHYRCAFVEELRAFFWRWQEVR